MRRLLLVTIALCILAWITLTIQVFWICETNNPAWKFTSYPQCPVGKVVMISQAISKPSSLFGSNNANARAAFILSDAALMLPPSYIIYTASMPWGAKARLIAVFVATIAATGTSLLHVYAVLRVGGVLQTLAGTTHVRMPYLVLPPHP